MGVRMHTGCFEVACRTGVALFAGGCALELAEPLSLAVDGKGSQQEAALDEPQEVSQDDPRDTSACLLEPGEWPFWSAAEPGSPPHQCLEIESDEKPEIVVSIGLRRFNGWHDTLSPVEDPPLPGHEDTPAEGNPRGEVHGFQELFISEDKAGLSLVDGKWRIMGLATYRGSDARDGLPVNCHGRDEGSCAGRPDGLLSAEGNGMLSQSQNSHVLSEATPDGPGIRTARYLVGCALSLNQVIEVYDWSGERITLEGEAGLCPGWTKENSTVDCEERVSACMLALSNGEAESVDIEMSSAIQAIGSRQDSDELPHYEASFYGNLFTRKTDDEYPTAFACLGTDQHLPRIAHGYIDLEDDDGGDFVEPLEQSWTTPVMVTGYCHKAKAACRSGCQGEWESCKGADGNQYEQVISTHRRLACEDGAERLVAAADAAARCSEEGVDCDWDYPTGWGIAE